MRIERTRILRVGGLQRFAALGDVLVDLDLLGLRRLEIVGIDVGRLVRGIDASAAGGKSCTDRLFEFARVEESPRVLRGFVFGERFAIAEVQPLPMFLQRGTGKFVRLVLVRKRGPAGTFGRHRVTPWFGRIPARVFRIARASLH